MEIIELPIQYLAAAVLATAHKDVRFYLEGVKVGDGIVAGTNGHCAVIIEADELKDVPEMIIPKEAINNLVRKVKVRNFNSDRNLTIEPYPLREGYFVLSYQWEHGYCDFEVFKPIDWKFPDVMRVLVKREESHSVAPFFSFDYLAIMAKAKNILMPVPVKTIQALYGENENDVAYFPLGMPNYHGLVMPMRT